MKEWKAASFSQDPNFETKLARRILLSKGQHVVPKQVYYSFTYTERPSVMKIKEVMGKLCQEGLGVMDQVQVDPKRKNKSTVFTKADPKVAGPLLEPYRIDMYKYSCQFFKEVQNQTPSPPSNMPKTTLEASDSLLESVPERLPHQVVSAPIYSADSSPWLSVPNVSRSFPCFPGLGPPHT